MKLSVALLCLLVTVHGLSLQKPLQPKGPQGLLQHSVDSKSKNLPQATQDFEPGAEHLDKQTPGAACKTFTDCSSCAEIRTCAWVPDSLASSETGECVETRDPRHEQGMRLEGCGKPPTSEVVDEPSDEHDDYADVHINGDPNDVNIASLKGGEQVYTEASELGRNDDAIEVTGPLDIENGLTHEEYNGHIGSSIENGVDTKADEGGVQTTAAP